MSFFSRLDRLASQTVDRLNGERFRLTPMAEGGDPNGRRVPDPTRSTITATGIFDLDPAPFGIEIGNRHVSQGDNDFRSLAVGRRPVLSIARGHLPQMPRQGDLVELLARPEAEAKWRVVSCRPDGESRVELVLVQA